MKNISYGLLDACIWNGDDQRKYAMAYKHMTGG